MSKSLSRRAALVAGPAAIVTATSPSAAVGAATDASEMQRAVAAAEAAWTAFFIAEAPEGDVHGDTFTALADLARDAQRLALEAPITSTEDAIALLNFARKQFITWGNYAPTPEGAEESTELGYPTLLDWSCFDRACEYLSPSRGPLTLDPTPPREMIKPATRPKPLEDEDPTLIAYQAWLKARADWYALPGDVVETRVGEEASQREEAAFQALLATEPMTMRGLAAFAHILWDREGPTLTRDHPDFEDQCRSDTARLILALWRGLTGSEDLPPRADGSAGSV